MKISMKQKKALAGLGFVSPLVIGLLIIFIPSIVKALIFSVSNININSLGYTLENVGVTHFKNALQDNPLFVQELVASIWNMVLNVPLIIAFSFFMAGILNQNFHGRTFIRAILFLPVIVSAGVIVKLDDLDLIAGIVQSGQVAEAVASIDITKMFLTVGIPPQFVTYIAEAVSRIYQVITDAGVQILIFLAALQTIPISLYEASTIEGATSWENFWKITFPMLSPYILTNAVYSVIDSLASYKSPVMQVITDMAQGSNSNMPYSIAMAFLFFATVVVILVLFVFLISRVVFYYE